MKINTDVARRIDIVARRGNTFTKVLSVFDVNAQLFDFTGYVARLEVYTSSSDGTPNLIFEAGNGLALAAGSITLSKTSSQLSTFRNRSYIYYLWITNPQGDKQLWLNGSFIIHEGVHDDFADGVNVGINSIAIFTQGKPVILNINIAN